MIIKSDLAKYTREISEEEWLREKDGMYKHWYPANGQQPKPRFSPSEDELAEIKSKMTAAQKAANKKTTK